MFYQLLLFALLVFVYGGPDQHQPKRFDVVPEEVDFQTVPLSFGFIRPPYRHSIPRRMRVKPKCPNIRNPYSYHEWYRYNQLKIKRKGRDFTGCSQDIILKGCISHCFDRNYRLWRCNPYLRFKLSFRECLKSCLSTRGKNNEFLLSDAFDEFAE